MSDGEGFDAQAFQDRTGVSDETLARYQVWLDLLSEVNAHTNLVGRSTLSEFWFRHALDSWQIFDLDPRARRWADLGAGAGFPGMALAFGVMAQEGPVGQIYCVESIAKKAAFLRRVSRETQAPMTVIHDRVEALSDIPDVDIVTARAMAPLDKLLNYVKPFVDKGAYALLPKGARYESELTEARKSWTFDLEVIHSQTAPDARILKIKGLARVK